MNGGINWGMFFAALYVSEHWHAHWRWSGRIYHKARAMVLFDRVITGRHGTLPSTETP